MNTVAVSTEEQEAIAASIRGGFIRILITDIHTAQWLAHAAEAEQLSQLDNPPSLIVIGYALL